MPKLRTLLVISLSPLSFACDDQPEPPPIVAATEPTTPAELTPGDIPLQENATFLLHKVERRVGEERVRMHGSEIRTIFAHAERGERTPLAATLRFGVDGRPNHFAMWGKTSSLTEVDIDVIAADGQITIREGAETRTIPTPELYFTAFGYAPIAIKEALIAFWHRHGRPEQLTLLPSGTAEIRERGDDVFDLDGKQITLERLDVGGVKWGREVVWIDAQQRLIAVMTTDALYNTTQAVREGYEPLLGEFLRRAGVEGKTLIDEKGMKPLHEGRYAIIHARLVDGTGAAPIDDAVIMIDDGKIVSAGIGVPPEGMPILDARGQTVLPGLWDMHAHFEQAEWGPVYLGAGVTTVRDLGNSLSFLTGVRGGKLAPRLLCAGLVDGVDGNAVGNLIIGSIADIEPVLAKIEAAGCVQVKVYASLDPALVAPLAEAAHRRGLEVVGHMPRDMKMRDAVNAGFDMISHTDAILAAVVPPSPQTFLDLDVDGPRAREAYAFLAEHGTVYDPTLGITEFFVLGVPNEPGIAKLPPELAGIFASLPAPTDPASPEGQTKQRSFDKVVEVIGAMHRAGVVIVAGSDSGVAGHSLHREIELYVRAGMTPMAAIQSATSVPARVMGLDREVGTIAPGMVADLILIDGDPLLDISDIRKITTVVTGGRAYETAGLWSLAGFEP